MTLVTTCHADRPHYAKGLCRACYNAAWKAANPGRVKASKRAEYQRNIDRYRTASRRYYEEHRDTIIAKVADWNRRHPGRSRDRQRERDYGLSPEAFAEQFRLHGGRCAICHREEPLAVDHDHATGQYRGLLCHHCNRALGHLRDNPEVARAAAAYLERDR